MLTRESPVPRIFSRKPSKRLSPLPLMTRARPFSPAAITRIVRGRGEIDRCALPLQPRAVPAAQEQRRLLRREVGAQADAGGRRRRAGRERVADRDVAGADADAEVAAPGLGLHAQRDPVQVHRERELRRDPRLDDDPWQLSRRGRERMDGDRGFEGLASEVEAIERQRQRRRAAGEGAGGKVGVAGEARRVRGRDAHGHAEPGGPLRQVIDHQIDVERRCAPAVDALRQLVGFRNDLRELRPVEPHPHERRAAGRRRHVHAADDVERLQQVEGRREVGAHIPGQQAFEEPLTDLGQERRRIHAGRRHGDCLQRVVGPLGRADEAADGERVRAGAEAIQLQAGPVDADADRAVGRGHGRRVPAEPTQEVAKRRIAGQRLTKRLQRPNDLFGDVSQRAA